MAMLYRKITSYIEDYLKSDNDKILILEGARQIGKSFSIREAGTRLGAQGTGTCLTGVKEGRVGECERWRWLQHEVWN